VAAAPRDPAGLVAALAEAALPVDATPRDDLAILALRLGP
jgi:hypothetical protein